jgi:protein-tyrosine phosphatase
LTPQRVLHWDGCVNVRDLGGLPTESGQATRFGEVVRADEIPRLSEQGWRAVQEYGISVAIDLRGPFDERDGRPPDLPIRVVKIPIDPRAVPAAFRWESMADAYRSLLEAYPAAFARAVETIGREREPVVVHCAGGRDRTGLAVALLLRLAGVDAETIAADHALSDESWAPYHPMWFAEAANEDERARRRRIAVPAGRTMVEVLAAVERRYGGPEQYLLEAGASPAGLAAARGRLIG